MVGSPEAVVAGTVGGGFAGQPKRLRRGDGQRRRWFAVSGEDVQDDRGGVDPFAECFGTRSLHGLEPVGQHGAEDVDHLAVSVRHPAEPALHASHGGRQLPLLERRAVPERARLAREHGHVVPGVVDHLVPPEGPRMLGHDLAVDEELIGALAEVLHADQFLLHRLDALQLLRAAHRPAGAAPQTGAELVAYWQVAGLIGTRNDIADSQEYARKLRAEVLSRNP